MGYKCAFTALAIGIIGLVIGVLLIGIIVLAQIDMNGLDSSILLTLSIALCISVVLLAYAFYAIYCYGKYSRMVLGVVFIILATGILMIGISVLVMRSNIVRQARYLWSEKEVSAAGKWLEEKLECCGFDDSTKRNCQIEARCEDKLSSLIENYSGWIAGISIGISVVVYLILIYAWWQLCKNTDKGTDQLRTQSLEEPLQNTTDWF